MKEGGKKEGCGESKVGRYGGSNIYFSNSLKKISQIS